MRTLHFKFETPPPRPRPNLANLQISLLFINHEKGGWCVWDLNPGLQKMKVMEGTDKSTEPENTQHRIKYG